MTLRLLEFAIKEGKFKYYANEKAARDFIALKILNVQYANRGAIEDAYARLVAVNPNWNAKQKRAHKNSLGKYNDARNHLLLA